MEGNLNLDWNALFPAGVGAIAGATAAFALGAIYNSIQTRRRNVAAIRRCYYVFFSQWQSIRDLKFAAESFFGGPPDPSLILREIHPLSRTPEIDYESLWFIGESRDPDLVNRINIVEKIYLAAEYYVEKLLQIQRQLKSKHHEKIIVHDVASGSVSIPLTELDEIDWRSHHRALSLSVNRAEEALQNMLSELETFVKKEFPGDKMIRFHRYEQPRKVV